MTTAPSAAPSTEPSSTPPKKQRLNFDRKLWSQFVKVAQPYFYPVEPYGTRRFLALVATQLVFVVVFTFFLIIGLALIGLLTFSQFFKRMVDDVAFLSFLKSFLDLDGLAQQYQIALPEGAEAFSNLADLTEVPGQVVALEVLRGLIVSPIFYGALGVLLFCLAAFFVVRRKLQGRFGQWFVLGVILFLAFAVSGLNVIISYSFRFIDNSLAGFAGAASAAEETAAQTEFWQFLGVYAIVLIVAIPILVTYVYLQRKLALSWRNWMTRRYLDLYFQNRTYYELDSNAANTEIDNPDQRITQDIDDFTRTILSLLLDILNSVLDLVAFIGILFSIAPILTGGLAGYATVGTFLAIAIGSRLLKIDFTQLRLEANFRYGMVRVRDNAESIAFYRGEEVEDRQVSGRLRQAIKNYNLKIIWLAILGAYRRAYFYFARLVPYVIVAPIFFAKNIDFGAIGQAVFAFRLILDALSLITERIDEISRFSASVVRLGNLYEHFERNIHSEAGGTRGDTAGDRIQTYLAPEFRIQNLSLRTPNNEQTLFENLNLTLGAEDSLLIVGASGCGKSSFLRALAGLWKNGSGTIERPDNSEILFLPQKPYMLLGSLREQLVYPNMRSNLPDREITEALQLVNLEALPDRVGGLDIEKDWTSVLSLGEQQRLAFARILLNRPKYVMLDEATSALDVANERRLYDLLRSLDMLYISVGHRPSLRDYHQSVLEIGAGNEGWQLTSAENYRFEAG